MIANTFLVGAPKCGTTSLATYLSGHPNVFVPHVKESFYWASDLKPGRHELRPGSDSAYRSLFKEADPEIHSVVIDGSTSYLRSRVAVPSIVRSNSGARFIAMLRNPVEVAVAFHMEQCFNGSETVQDFGLAWALQEEREAASRDSSGLIDDQLLYRRNARFGEQIRRFLDSVPEEQRLVILLEDLAGDPSEVYRSCLDFLGLDDDGREHFPVVNASHVQRFPTLSRAILQPPAGFGRPVRALRREMLTRDSRLARSLKSRLRVEQPRAAVDPEVRADLRQTFESEVLLLEELLERDLAHWRQ